MEDERLGREAVAVYAGAEIRQRQAAVGTELLGRGAHVLRQRQAVIVGDALPATAMLGRADGDAGALGGAGAAVGGVEEDEGH